MTVKWADWDQSWIAIVWTLLKSLNSIHVYGFTLHMIVV